MASSNSSSTSSKTKKNAQDALDRFKMEVASEIGVNLKEGYNGDGIPSKKRVLKEGDIVSLDAGVIHKGYHSDAARTYGIGKISDEAAKLIEVTRQSFFEGIKYAKEGCHLYEISNAIAQYNESFGYGVIRDLVGHGIGTELHEEPEIPNFRQDRRGIRLYEGMTLAIEPMVSAGDYKVRWLDDNWTASTFDHSLSAHYENTVLVTKAGPEIGQIVRLMLTQQ